MRFFFPERNQISMLSTQDELIADRLYLANPYLQSCESREQIELNVIIIVFLMYNYNF